MTVLSSASWRSRCGHNVIDALHIGTPLFSWRMSFLALQVRQPISPQAKANSLTQHEAPLRLSNESGDQCTLFFSMSRVPESGDERQSAALDSQILEAQSDRPRFSHNNPMASQWDAAFRQLYRLFKVFNQCSVQVLRKQLCFGLSCDVQIRLLHFFSIQWSIYRASKVSSYILIRPTFWLTTLSSSDA